MVKRLVKILTAFSIVSIVLAGAPARAAHASTTWTVESTGDGAANGANCPGSGCRLRDAIANVSAGDTIDFNVTGTISLNAGEMDIANNVTITGPGASQLTIDAMNASRIFTTSAASVLISGLTLTNGLANATTAIGAPPLAGAAVMNFAGLRLDGMVITNSTVDCGGPCASNGIDGGGGAVASESGTSLTITNSTISHNSASFFGGGVYFNSGTSEGDTLSLSNDTIASNQQTGASTGGGGGLAYGHAQAVTLSGVKVLSNTAVGVGGGMSTGAGPLLIFQSTFDSNQSGIDSFVGGGGGIYLSSSGGSLFLGTSTFSGNSSLGSGGAIYDGGVSAVIYNSTFTANSETSPSLYGGAISSAFGSTLLLRNDTIAGNGAASGQAGGLLVSTGSVSIENTIVSNSTSGASDCASYGLVSWTATAASLIQTNDGVKPCPSVALSSDPKLGPLANNGGPTETMALLSGSPAINAGDNGYCGNLFTVSNLDQRGVLRPQLANCDIGAYELELNAVDVFVVGNLKGVYDTNVDQGQQHAYGGTNSGPAQVVNSTLGGVVSSIRVLFGGTSYSEMMGYPNNSTTQFWFPWYNDVAFDSQFRVSNLGASSTTITVTLGGGTIDSFSLAAGAAIRKNYAGQNNGPMHVSSSGQPILATIRVLFGGTSFSEMMGFPNNSTTNFWFPWYNNTAMDSQFRVSNLGGSSTTITVFLAGSPIDSFTLPAGVAIRKNYVGQNNGPLQVSSSGGEPILATIRVLFGGASYSEMMGFPNSGTTSFFFPWYDNVGADTQVRVSNLGGSPTNITVNLDGSPIDVYSLGPGAAIRKNYPTLNSGDLHVTSSGQPILVTERILYGGTSFYELMGFPDSMLSSTQYFPWYNNTAMDSQLRFTTVP